MFKIIDTKRFILWIRHLEDNVSKVDIVIINYGNSYDEVFSVNKLGIH